MPSSDSKMLTESTHARTPMPTDSDRTTSASCSSSCTASLASSAAESALTCARSAVATMTAAGPCSSTPLATIASSAEDAIVASGVLEHGPAAVMVATADLAHVSALSAALLAKDAVQLELHEAEVVRSESVGMGVRACVDSVSIFESDEGILVGSTSGGGVLVCAEVHYLPYMKLRPFGSTRAGSTCTRWPPTRARRTSPNSAPVKPSSP